MTFVTYRVPRKCVLRHAWAVIWSAILWVAHDMGRSRPRALGSERMGHRTASFRRWTLRLGYVCAFSVRYAFQTRATPVRVAVWRPIGMC